MNELLINTAQSTRESVHGLPAHATLCSVKGLRGVLLHASWNHAATSTECKLLERKLHDFNINTCMLAH